MGLFSRSKCPVHKIEYSIGKDYMCQPFYYCKQCLKQNQNQKKLEQRVKELERKMKIHHEN